MQDVLWALEVHQLVSQIEALMQDATAKFAQDMYQYVHEEVAKPVDELTALDTDLKDIQQNQTSEVQL